MFRFIILIFATLFATSYAAFSGPYLFWGYQKVVNLQPRALVEAKEEDFVQLFKETKAIVIFLRNEATLLSVSKFPKFQDLVQKNAWAYLPQRSIAVEPFNYNANVEVIQLNGTAEQQDTAIINGFNEALTIFGDGEVLGILASGEEDSQHFIAKRQAKPDKEDEERATTASPTTDETEESFIYVAKGKAVLYVNSAPVLNISNSKEPIKLLEHNKAITFDDQKAKGYGRLTIIFNVEGEKLFGRFNFTLSRGTWSMKAIEIEYKEYKTILPIVGRTYDVPSAPVGFSYRCSSRQVIFTNGNDTLVINDYQVQPWLNGATRFGDVYNCIGFITAPIWAGILVSFFLCGILAIGIMALMDVKTPNRFESSRSKQLQFTVQD